MTIALSIIREEHRSLDYIEGFSGRFHHPKEEAYLFSALRRRCAEASEALDVLERDHARGEELMRHLRYLLSRCRVGGEAVESFAAAIVSTLAADERSPGRTEARALEQARLRRRPLAVRCACSRHVGRRCPVWGAGAPALGPPGSPHEPRPPHLAAIRARGHPAAAGTALAAT